MMSRALTNNGTPPSIAAIMTVSYFVRLSLLIVKRRAIARADGIRFNVSASAFSVRFRLVAHSLTTRREPRKPCVLIRRHSSVAFVVGVVRTPVNVTCFFVPAAISAIKHISFANCMGKSPDPAVVSFAGQICRTAKSSFAACGNLGVASGLGYCRSCRRTCPCCSFRQLLSARWEQLGPPVQLAGAMVEHGTEVLRGLWRIHARIYVCGGMAGSVGYCFPLHNQWSVLTLSHHSHATKKNFGGEGASGATSQS